MFGYNYSIFLFLLLKTSPTGSVWVVFHSRSWRLLLTSAVLCLVVFSEPPNLKLFILPTEQHHLSSQFWTTT